LENNVQQLTGSACLTNKGTFQAHVLRFGFHLYIIAKTFNMNKANNSVGYNKSRAKQVAKSKAANAITEAKLRARKNAAVKAIVIGSAALGVAALSLFAFKRYKKKKNQILSLWD
jgi:hypothetical protein